MKSITTIILLFVFATTSCSHKVAMQPQETPNELDFTVSQQYDFYFSAKQLEAGKNRPNYKKKTVGGKQYTHAVEAGSPVPDWFDDYKLVATATLAEVVLHQR